jgi:4-amino-4-deoxy-L-arabinose transferase-like glycosyltransferase
LTYRVLSLVSRQWAFIAVCFELLTATFLVEARAISLDQILATVTVACFVLVYRKVDDVSISLRSWAGILCLLVIGFSIRGPMGIVIPVGVICSYFALTNQWPAIFKMGVLALALLAACWVTLLFLARIEGGETFASDVVRMQVTGRMGGKEDMLPYYYYLTSSLSNFAVTFPFALVTAFVVVSSAWSHLSIPLLKKSSRQEWDPVLRMAVLIAGWFVVLLIGLSIPQTKKARYLLPAVPAIAALASYMFIAQGSKLLSFCHWLLQKLLLILPMLLAVVTVYATHYAQQHKLLFDIHSNLLLFLLACCQFVQLHSALYLKRHSDYRDKIIVAVAALAFWSTNVLLREPVDIQMHAARPFVEKVETLRRDKPAPIVMYNIGKDSIGVIYHVNVEGEFNPEFINQPNQLPGLVYPLYLMINDKNISSLQAAASSKFQVELPMPIYQGFFRDGNYTVYYLEHSPL